MEPKGKLKLGSNRDAAKRRKVGFSADDSTISCNANDCLQLHLVLSGEDLQIDHGAEDCTFDPEFSERIFGEDGKIYGYKGLKIDLWLHAATFHAYVQIHYDSKIAGGKKPFTDVFAKLKEVFGDGLTNDREAFIQSLMAYSNGFEQMLRENGKVVTATFGNSWSNGQITDDENKRKTSAELKKIVRMELKDPAVRAWHARGTPLSLLFIEGAQPIQDDDPEWEVYVALEGVGPQMKVVGFCNVYQFYHYPDSTRLRISQILVLPPYQGKGFGFLLLEIVNSTAIHRNCYDVTMEEPSVALQKLRDTMDVLRVLSLPSLNAAIEDASSNLHRKKALGRIQNSGEFSGYQTGAHTPDGNNSDELSQSLSMKEKSLLVPPAQLVEEVRMKFKISKVQFKRCWEQLLFMYLDPEDRDLQDVFQEALVQRLNVEIFEKENENKNVNKHIVDTENEYDDSKTFVMMRVRKISSASVNGSGISSLQEVSAADYNGVLAVTPAAEDKGKVLEEELQEREDELLAVAQHVSRHCGPLGLSIPFLKTRDQGYLSRRKS